MNKISILFFEDEKYGSELKEYLEETDQFSVTLQKTGTGAAKIVQATNPDIILMDVILEIDHQDGFVLADELRKLPAFKHIPILILTQTLTRKGARRSNKDQGERTGVFWMSKSESHLRILARIAAILFFWTKNRP